MSGEGHNTETFQTSAGDRHGGSESHSLFDLFQEIQPAFKYRCDETGSGHSSESINKGKQS